jgi:5'-methylthioadenosine phosphorylase
VHDKGTYVCTEGPRFETAAEVKLYAALGGDVVGMTSVPECVLAREAEICYATVSMVTNYGAGITDLPLTHKEVIDTMAENGEKIRRLIMKTVELIGTAEKCCKCGEALREFGGFKL